MPCLTKAALATQLCFIVESPTFFTPVSKSYMASAQSDSDSLTNAPSTHHQRAPVRAETGKSLIYLIPTMPAPVQAR
jgi:hypothetical protein